MFVLCYPENQFFYRLTMLRRKESNLRPLGYEPSELPTATTPLCYPYAKLKTYAFNIRTKKPLSSRTTASTDKKVISFVLLLLK